MYEHRRLPVSRLHAALALVASSAAAALEGSAAAVQRLHSEIDLKALVDMERDVDREMRDEELRDLVAGMELRDEVREQAARRSEPEEKQGVSKVTNPSEWAQMFKQDPDDKQELELMVTDSGEPDTAKPSEWSQMFKRHPDDMQELDFMVTDSGEPDTARPSEWSQMFKQHPDDMQELDFMVTDSGEPDTAKPSEWSHMVSQHPEHMQELELMAADSGEWTEVLERELDRVVTGSGHGSPPVRRFLHTGLVVASVLAAVSALVAYRAWRAEPGTRVLAAFWCPLVLLFPIDERGSTKEGEKIAGAKYPL